MGGRKNENFFYDALRKKYFIVFFTFVEGGRGKGAVEKFETNDKEKFFSRHQSQIGKKMFKLTFSIVCFINRE